MKKINSKWKDIIFWVLVLLVLLNFYNNRIDNANTEILENRIRNLEVQNSDFEFRLDYQDKYHNDLEQELNSQGINSPFYVKFYG